LRAAPGAHPAVRRLAREAACQIQAAHPLLADAMRLAEEPSDGPRADDFLMH
jgi:hypothetical protein